MGLYRFLHIAVIIKVQVIVGVSKRTSLAKALILSSFSAMVGVSPAKKGIEKVPDIRNTMLHKHKTALKQQKVKVRIFRLWKFQYSWSVDIIHRRYGNNDANI